MAVEQVASHRYVALKTDAKPADDTYGAKLYERDTGQWFIFDGTDWRVLLTTTIDWGHARIHSGKAWLITHRFSGVADDGTADIVVSVGSDVYHTLFAGASQGDYLFDLFEAPSWSGGSDPSVANRHRPTGDAGAPTAKYSPTVSDTGTCLLDTSSGPGGRGGNSPGSARDWSREIVLASNTDYLFRMTNKRGQSSTMSLAIDLYQPV